MNIKKIVLILLVVAVGGFLLIQIIPFGHIRTNPPIVSEPNWSSQQARAVVKQHCFQCHSNETNWTWYANIAPGSWLIAMDVIEGRNAFNFSDWQNNPGRLKEMVRKVQKGDMPPIQYWIFHPQERMSDQQKQEVISALQSSIQSSNLQGLVSNRP